MSGFSISPWDSLVFVGTDMGTLFRSEDAGSTWEPVSHLEARYTSHLDIAGPVGFTSSPNVLLFASCKHDQDCVAQRSEDRGVTWSAVDVNGDGTLTADNKATLSRFVRYWAAALDHTGLVFAATENGVDRSADLGLAWAPVAPGVVKGDAVGTFVDEGTTPPTVYHGTTEGVFSWTDGPEPEVGGCCHCCPYCLLMTGSMQMRPHRPCLLARP